MCPKKKFVGKNFNSSVEAFEQNFPPVLQKNLRRFSKLHSRVQRIALRENVSKKLTIFLEVELMISDFRRISSGGSSK